MAIRSPEQQFAFAKTLPMNELVKVMQGQSDVVDMYIADMMLRQKMPLIKAQQGAQAMQVAQGPKVAEKDVAEAQQLMRPEINQGVASLPADIDVPEYAGGGIVAFQAGGQSSLPFPEFSQRTPIGPALQSTRVPGPGPTFASAFPNAASAASTVSRMPGLLGRIGAFALGPMMALESMTGPSADEVTKLKEFDRAKEILKAAGFTDKDIAALATTDVYRMAAGYGYKPLATIAPAAQTAPSAPGQAAPQGEPEAPAETAKPKDKGIASLVAPKIPVPAELTPEQAGQERLSYYKERGISQDPYAAYRKSIEKERAEEPEARREAGWMRALEAGLGIMGGESPYAFTNIGKGAQAAAKGAAEDMKEFRKLERERKREEARLAIDQNNYLKSGADSDLAKVEKRRDTINAIGLKQAELDKDIAVANKNLEAHALTRADTKDATLKATALKQAEAEMAKRLALNPQLAQDPTAYSRELDNIYYEHLRRLMGEKAPTKPGGGNLQNVNGSWKYVPNR